MPVNLDDLNPEQRVAAVHGEGPLMVLAGAGTGKTRVLTYRIAHLVEEHDVPAPEILAVTFTNKAAGEMRDRLGRLLGERGWGMWIGTFHATCARLLRRHCREANLPRDFTIFDDDDQMRLVKSILKEMGTSERITPRAVLSRIDRWKNAGQDPERITSRDYVDDVARRALPAYQSRLEAEGACDFNDLLLKVLRLFEDSELGAALSRRFVHVLVDEFQDTNLVQYHLVRHFAAGFRNLCVVGDDDQSIYRWRGAEPKNLLEFDRDFPDARVVKLERNYRSTGVILQAANAVISRNRHRHEKALWTERQGGEPLLLEECDDERGEAEFIARGIAGLISAEGRGLADFAVLYRTHAQSRVLEEAFRRHKIAYRIVGGVSFFRRREIKDITEYLRILSNPLADSALERVINVPARGIGGTTMDRVKAHARDARIPLLEAVRSCAAGAIPEVKKGARRRLDAFLEIIDGLRELLSSGTTVSTLISEVIERTGYAERLEIEDKVDAPDRLQNLGELVAAAATYDQDTAGEGTLGGFLEQIALVSGLDEKDGRQADEGEQAVTLMTIHAAKGLEFPVIFLAGMEEGVFPLAREGSREDDMEEERRLAYVALTRAMDRIVLTHARARRHYDQIRRNPPSRFLGDLPVEVVAVRARPAPPPRPAPRPRDEYHFDQRPAFEHDEPVYYVDDDLGGDDPTFPVGAHVRHKIFGVGRIQNGSGRGPDRKLTVHFPEHGTKTIVARFVEPA